jgi:hypothetical protein
MLSRRSVMRLSFSQSCAGAIPLRCYESVVHVGAIRWDAWDATGSEVLSSAERSLSDTKFHSRAPFCARRVTGSTMSFATCSTQTAMDFELTVASAANISYWAFCWYDKKDPMMKAWNFYQSSLRRNKVNWCILLSFSRMNGIRDFRAKAIEFISYFHQENYMKVLSGRPLIYIFVDQTRHLSSDWNDNWTTVRSAFNELRAGCASKGISNPYIVIMEPSPLFANRIKIAVDADAISNYIAPLPSGRTPSYASLDTCVRSYWATMAATGSEVVPICMTGWDPRPRQEHPPSWEFAQGSTQLTQNYVEAGTPREIANHILAGKRYIIQNPDVCKARVLLIYSWNECDEGGSTLLPSFSASGPANQIITAVGDALKDRS